MLITKQLNLVVTLIMLLGFASCAHAKQIKIADENHPVKIICPNSSEIKEMGCYLQNFIKDRHFAVESKLSARAEAKQSGFQWVITDVKNLASMGDKISAPVFDKQSRDEAYMLLARPTKSGAQIFLVGKTADGVRAAVARLICKVANDGRHLWIEEGNELNDPFINKRLLCIGNSPRRQMPFCSPFKDADLETWPLSRIRAYPELFWQFGYNGVQIMETRGYSSVSDENLPRIRKAVQTLAKGAKSHKLYVSLFQWGDCLFREGETFSWNNPQERKIMRLFMKDIAESYGSLIDHFNIHVGDPGGCTRDGCDAYKTTQQVTAAFLEAFLKVNHSMQCSLSTWANSRFWASAPRLVDLTNYNPPFPEMANAKDFGLPIPDGAKFLDDAFMPGDVGISLNRVYNADQASMVVAAGRPVDIWSWYVGDNEMINSLWFNMTEIDKILSALPDRARNDIRSYTIELTFHGWPQIINSYVAAQKLWNPKSRLDQSEHEFCTAVFGPTNADAMLDVYRACENGWTSTIPSPPDFGTATYNERLRTVFAKSEKVRLSAGWKPNFTLPVPAQKYVDMLNARLQLILAVSEAKLNVDNARKNGANAESIAEIKQKAIQSIPVLTIDPIYRQDNTIVGSDQAIPSGFATTTFAQMIEKL